MEQLSSIFIFQNNSAHHNTKLEDLTCSGSQEPFIPLPPLLLPLVACAPWPFVCSPVIHDTSVCPFCDGRMEALFYYGGNLVIAGFLGHLCARARNEVDTLGGDNVEPVLQVRAVSARWAATNAKHGSKDASFTISRSWLAAAVVSCVADRDVMASG